MQKVNSVMITFKSKSAKKETLEGFDVCSFCSKTITRASITSCCCSDFKAMPCPYFMTTLELSVEFSHIRSYS